MFNENTLLQQHRIQKIKLTLITCLLVFLIFFVSSIIFKDDTAVTVKGKTQITAIDSDIKSEIPATKTTTSVPVISNQHSDTNSYVLNYLNAWKLTKVI